MKILFYDSYHIKKESKVCDSVSEKSYTSLIPHPHFEPCMYSPSLLGIGDWLLGNCYMLYLAW